mmetsp:Transcript_17486/g.51714  ORF Transcript_17486/g.51714 Transcript_17486/m.51714 type:complete len:202 (+) Transcript_17486:566-1171(+)
MVYSRPEEMRYRSAFRFQSSMSPPEPSSSLLPIELRKLSGCVPPMLDTNTNRFTPAALAASICSFAPSQSTSSGVPPGANLNLGRPGSARRRTTFWKSTLAIEKGRICGTAEVQSTTLSHPAIAAARAAPSVTSACTISASSAPPTLRSALTAFLLRTNPTGAKDALSLSCWKTSLPVRPPAPVTSTLRAEPDATRRSSER